MDQSYAPGQPGIPPRWTSSAKSGVGTSLSTASRVWFTLSHGILNEVYYPRIDQACIRDMELLVSDGQDFFSEEKRQTTSQIEMLVEGVPAFQLTNTCNEGRYCIHKTVLTDPQRDVLLQKIRFEPLKGQLNEYHLYVLLAPHLGNHGAGNTAWVDDYKGLPVLNAQRGEIALSLASSAPWLKRSVGFVGASDGWQDVSAHKQMQWEYTRAEDGNIALTGEVELAACNGEFILAIGFGLTASESALRARASLQAFANPGGLLPEQTWDGLDIPERELFFGKPSGSAMPLVWAHAEYLKLCRSLADGRVFDMPTQTAKRYSLVEHPSDLTIWAFNHKVRKLPHGNILRLCLPSPARVRWSADEWATEKEAQAHDSTLGVHVADLPTRTLKSGTTIRFTIYWLDHERWDGNDYVVEIA